MAVTRMRVRQIKDVEVPGLGKRIKEARVRISNQKSLERICEEVDLSRTYWYDLEKEKIKGTLSIEKLRLIEKALEVDFGIQIED